MKATEGLKGLDEMAAADEYVHSDGLNVKRVDDDDHEHEMVPLTNDTSSAFESGVGGYQDEAHAPLHQPTILSPTTIQIATPETPIRPAVERSKPTMAPHVLEIETAPESPDHLDNSGEEENDLSFRPPRSNRSKSSGNRKHRFLEELDQRVSKENLPTMSPTTFTVMTPSVRASLSSSSNSTTNGTNASNWSVFGGLMKNSIEGNAESQEPREGKGDNAEQEGNLPPLSRQRLYKSISSTNGRKGDDLNNVAKVSSMGMLDADDLLALEQIKIESQQETSWAEIVQQHPRESFIALTMVLSVTVYFWMRKFSKEDDID